MTQVITAFNELDRTVAVSKDGASVRLTVSIPAYGGRGGTSLAVDLDQAVALDIGNALVAASAEYAEFLRGGTSLRTFFATGEDIAEL